MDAFKHDQTEDVTENTSLATDEDEDEDEDEDVSKPAAKVKTPFRENLYAKIPVSLNTMNIVVIAVIVLLVAAVFFGAILS